MANIGEKIRRIRCYRGLTQKTLGSMVGLSEPAIRNYELGNRSPKQDTVDAIADVLNVNPAYLTNSDMQDIDSVLIQLFQIDDNFPISVQNSVDEYGNNHYGLYFSSDMINTLLSIWYNKQQGVVNGTINKSDYEEWKLSYPYDMGR